MPVRSHSLALWIIAAVSVAVGWASSCSDPDAPSTTTAGGSAGPGSGGAAAGGQAGTGGVEPVAQPPIWGEPILVAGCQIIPLMNPADVRVFHLEPCASGFMCEQGFFREPFVIGPDANVATTDLAVLPQLGTVLAYALQNTQETFAVFTDEKGWAIAGMRVPALNDGLYCDPDLVGVGHGRLAFGVRSVTSDANAGESDHMGIAYVQTDDPTTLVGFNLVEPVPLGLGPMYYNALGPNHWVWQFGPVGTMVSVPLDPAGAWSVVAKYDMPEGTLDAIQPVWAGDRFLVSLMHAGGDVIAWSDGISTVETYVTPPAGTFDFFPIVAGDYVAWQRGQGSFYGPKSDIELWASPLTGDPAGLQPKKIADLPGNKVDAAGGFGTVALPGTSMGVTYRELLLFDLESGETEVRPLPDDKKIFQFSGISEDAVWIVAQPPPTGTISRMIMRFPT